MYFQKLRHVGKKANYLVPELATPSYLLVVQFLGLPRFEELQQVPQRSLIVVSERIPWTVPVPGHHTTRQGGRTTKGRKEG